MKILITIPCYNEAKKLEKNLTKLNNYLSKNLKEEYTIEIADNNSKDNTKKISRQILNTQKNITYRFVKKQGKGLAIKESWNNSKKYDILAFMDADLATDISAFPKMVEKITKENYDLVYGSRYHKESKTKRIILRKIISKGYLFLQKIILGTSFTDTQCGFKAIKTKAYFRINQKFIKKRLSGDKNDMFFDTELLVLAKYHNFKITDYPVSWKEQKDSSVKLLKYSLLFFRYLFYFKKHLTQIQKKND
jgi:glycosyltransferase involved in cell wall biosynthesis